MNATMTELLGKGVSDAEMEAYRRGRVLSEDPMANFKDTVDD